MMLAVSNLIRKHKALFHLFAAASGSVDASASPDSGVGPVLQQEDFERVVAEFESQGGEVQGRGMRTVDAVSLFKAMDRSKKGVVWHDWEAWVLQSAMKAAQEGAAEVALPPGSPPLPQQEVCVALKTMVSGFGEQE